MRLIITGYGFIGRELVKAISERLEEIRRNDKGFKIVGVSDSKGYLYSREGLDTRRLCGLKELSDLPQYYQLGNSSIQLIENSKADLMIEATPTNIKDGEPGITHIRSALRKGIHVVTSNKGPLVVAFQELTLLAAKSGSEFRYEGTVAGAVPIFSLVRECLQADRILKISGILNGTTNYILSKMHFEETSFDIALKEAQARGLTEKDPSYDVDGIDATSKVVILANAIMKRDVKFADVARTGIREVTQEAIYLAKKSNYAIKLVGTIDSSLEVSPKLVPVNHPLCVHGTLNAIHLDTDLARELTLVGYGAGKETVSAVLNDMMGVLKKK